MPAELVTVAFVDVERSTELLVERGDIDGLAAVASVLGVVRERIEPYGGLEVKALGDGLMLVFPAPRQAVAFAVATQRALLGRRPRVRIGINTGEVANAADDPVGESVNAAARIAAKAAGGEVLVSDVVRQLVGTIPAVRFVDRGRNRLKGFSERWKLFVAVGSETEPEPSPVFGRETELSAVAWLLGGPTGGSGRILVLEGEAGIGKTHLADATRALARAAGVRVVATGADELEQDRPGRILLGLAVDLDASLTDLLDGDHRDGGSRGYAVIEAVGNALEDAVAKTPILVVVDDLQWADELSLRGLASVARRLAPLPAALLLMFRPSPRPPLLGRVIAAMGGTEAKHLHVERLDDVAVTSMIATLTGAAPGPTLATRIASAAGNPLYVIELVRSLEEDGALRMNGGIAEVDVPGLPLSLRHTIVQRLSGLPTDTMDVLRGASLLGREFVLADLATVMGRRVVDVASTLRAPVEMAVLSGAGDTLSFRHDLIREAVYDDIPAAIRRDLHTAAGRALATAGAPVAMVAQQLALGARPGDAHAVAWLERAAHDALALDLPAAVRLFEQAVALVDHDVATRNRIEIELLAPLAACGRVGEARATAAALLDRGIDEDQQFAVRRGLAIVTATAGDIASAVAECTAAAALPGAPEVEAAVLRCLAANMSLITGRPAGDVRPVAEDALADASRRGAAGFDLACVAHQTLALAAGIEGRYEEGADHARASRRLLFANPTMPTRGFLIPEVWEATFLLYTDRFDEAITTYGVASSRAERRGETSLLVQTYASVGFVHFLAGRWDDAVSEIETGIAVAKETGNHAHVVGKHAMLARIALGRGDRLGAESELAAGYQAVTEGGHLFGVDLLLWAKAGVLESADDSVRALSVLADGWDQTASLRGLVQYRNLGPDLARLAAAHGDLDRARSVADTMERIAARTTAPSALAAAMRARGLAEHDPDRMMDAVSLYRKTPRRLDLAHACEDAARVLLQVSDRSAAVDLLDEAASIHLDCGAVGNLARVDALLRAHNVRRRRHGRAPAPHGWESLSPTELNVVERVAQGLSNPQIGASLFISRRTVETHVSHIFRKLDVTTRSQLAALAVAHWRR